MNAREKILIVDDNPTNIEILQEYLENGYHLQIAFSGEEALAKAADFQPDLILLDIMMPGIDGYEVCRRIRATPALAHIKIIILSVKAMLSERLQGYTAGADDYITKPFEEEELLAKVRVYMRLKSVEEINELNSNLLALLSHETRTPLTSILMPLEMLLADTEIAPEKRKALLGIAYDSTQNLQKLLDKILLLSALKAGTAHFDWVEMDLGALIGAAVDAVAAKAAQGPVHITQDLTELAPVRLDRAKMQRVIESLLDNAIRFSPPNGQIGLRLTRAGRDCELSVTDQGEGISPAFLPQVFKEFACPDVNYHSHGHGLSLAIAQRVAQQHGGALTVAHAAPQGTVFTLRLPLADTGPRAA